MPFLVEEASANVELLLAWAVLPKYSQCCKEILTDQTWKRLRAHLHLGTVPLSQRHYIGHHIRRLYAARLGPVTHLANVPPNTILPALWGYGTHRPRSEPLRRVRVEHITPWSCPVGHRRGFVRLQDAFLTHGFDDFATEFDDFVKETMAGPIRQPSFRSWRHITHQPYQRIDLCAEFSTTTVRFLWRGFHVELAEQKRTILDLSSNDSASSPDTGSNSRSRSRSL